MAHGSIKVAISGLEDLNNDIKKFGSRLAASIAEYSAKELEEQCALLLDAYYSEYSPTDYQRTYQLHEKSHYPFLHYSPASLRASGGITISPTANGRMKYYNDFSPETVIGWFLDGIHGGYVDGWTQPWRTLCRVQDYILAEVCDGEIGRDMITKAKKGLSYFR